jgi:hypothetical protein
VKFTASLVHSLGRQRCQSGCSPYAEIDRSAHRRAPLIKAAPQNPAIALNSSAIAPLWEGVSPQT